MHIKWKAFIEEVNDEINRLESLGMGITFFRGHANENYKLLPSLYRFEEMDINRVERIETNIFYDFVSMAGNQIKNDNTWEILFTMRHHGVPTRLLDWTTSFAHSLYFALNSKNIEKPHIWILDPYKLNKKTKEFEIGLINPSYDLDNDYYEMFLNMGCKPNIKRPKFPIALYPGRNNPRIFAQQGVFTIHGTQIETLDKIAPECLKKIYIPTECLEDAKNFLSLAGIHEYSIYPDFTGLANYLKLKYDL